MHLRRFSQCVKFLARKSSRVNFLTNFNSVFGVFHQRAPTGKTLAFICWGNAFFSSLVEIVNCNLKVLLFPAGYQHSHKLCDLRAERRGHTYLKLKRIKVTSHKIERFPVRQRYSLNSSMPKAQNVRLDVCICLVSLTRIYL